ncbi:MAG: AMP-binding protein [Pseudonocardia sp.]|nr:AMP-binding protein [Pseudonocardia sp.]
MTHIGTVERGIAEWPAFWARYTPDRPALVFGQRVLSWRELEDGVARVAGGLRAAGIARGDRVGFLARNTPEFFEVLLACGRLGAIMVPFNVRLSAGEITHIAEDADISLLVTERFFDDRSDRILARLGTAYDLDDPPPGRHHYRDLHGPPLADGDDADQGRPAVTLDDPLLLVYTSGTTGHAKAAVITHGNATGTSIAVINADGIGPTDRIVVPAPLAFAGSVLSLGMPMMHAGASMVIEREIDPEHLLDLVEHGGVTMLKIVPVIYQMMAATPGFATRDLSGLRSATCGGSPVALGLLQTYQAKGVALSSAYGLTEGCGYNLCLPPEDVVDRIGWVGLPLPFQRCRVVDDDDRPVAAGEIGELTIAGPCVMAGYWRAPEATASTVRNGWLHTGDLAIADEHGYLRIVDRKKDMLISGGINVYPAEVERILVAHPDVVDVAVVGVPDPRWGEAPFAYVVTDDATLTLDRLVDGLRDELADFKRPRHLVVLDELPRNPNGKVLRRDLRDRARAHIRAATP